MDRGTRRAQRERMKQRAKRIFPKDPEAFKLADQYGFLPQLLLPGTSAQVQWSNFAGNPLRGQQSLLMAENGVGTHPAPLY
jgi:hypothetical protein